MQAYRRQMSVKGGALPSFWQRISGDRNHSRREPSSISRMVRA